MDFHLKRRQQFLSEDYFIFHRDAIIESVGYWKVNLPGNSGSEVAGRALAWSRVARRNADLFLLRYTAGEPLEELRDSLTDVIETYEQSAFHTRANFKSDDAPPLLLDELEDYERLMQLIGFCILFHRTDLLPRIALMFDATNAGDDALYEDVLTFYLDDRYDVEELLHQKPFFHLLKSIRRESSGSIEDIQKYLKAWYTAMKNLTWHDSHLDLTDSGAGYFGYWAIEAGAVAYLLELDDRSFREHLVYPKDLVNFARTRDTAPESSSTVNDDHSGLRVEGGQPCPQAGYWATPAQLDSRSLFKAGEIMPTFEHSAYGATIWQWSEEQ